MLHTEPLALPGGRPASKTCGSQCWFQGPSDTAWCPKRRRWGRWKDTTTGVGLQHHPMAGNGAHSSPKVWAITHICVLQLAVWSLLRGELVLLEQEASSAAFDRSQTGAWCQKKDDVEQTVVAAARIDWGLGQRAFPGLHCKASPRV